MTRSLFAAIASIALLPAQSIESVIDAARQDLAPDRRTAVFDVEPTLDGKTLTLRGTIHDRAMADQLLQKLTAQLEFDVVDALRTLPDAQLGDRIAALPTVSVANLRTEPRYGGELATQVLLGTPLRVLDRTRGGWLYVQTPNRYLGWTRSRLARMTDAEAQEWRRRPRLIVTATFATVHAEADGASDPVSDVVAGCLLVRGESASTPDHWSVEYPDGRTGFLARDAARPFEAWLADTDATPESIIATARRFLGVPYLWGGTSTKGMDCSGFTSTVYFMNGLLLPRDASQQVRAGRPVSLEHAEPGDLLFFGRREERRERVTHVGISLGGKRFIHCAGDVHIASLDPAADDFSEFRLRGFLRAKRMLGSPTVERIDESPAYRQQAR